MKLMKGNRISLIIFFAMFGLFLFACNILLPTENIELNNEEVQAKPTKAISTQMPAQAASPVEITAYDKYALWTNGTKLRGANTWQRIVEPEYDGYEFLGDGYIGPQYTQEDFDRLAALGANYVNLSHPGLFTERPPYVLDEQVQTNLDNMIAMAAQADLFVVITFRTGPGRNDFTFYRDDDWFADEDLIENIWHDADAQQAWVEMWRYTAERYKGNQVVVGYDLMCEPNAAEIVDEWDKDIFYATYGGEVEDWNRWYPQIVSAIREVDSDTPILIGGDGYSALDWLPYVQVINEPLLVYTFHQYAPSTYTHQGASLFANTYPGHFDADYDGQKEDVDIHWLKHYLSTANNFSSQYGVPVAVNEYGVQRWQPGAAQFMNDEMQMFEEMGLNYALWVWDPEWQPWLDKVNRFTFRFGDDPNSTEEIPSELQDVILEFWSHNTIRPSTYQ